jgi:hypothetical protein
MPRLQIDRVAWEAGFAAGDAGDKARCPYPAGTREAWSWESGRVEGAAKRKGFSYSRGAKPNPPDSPGVKRSRDNPGREPEADEDNRITQAVEVLRDAYRPAATRGALAEAIGEALDILDDAGGGDAPAA